MMRPIFYFMASTLLVNISTAAGFSDDFVRNVPHPTQKSSDGSWNNVGEESFAALQQENTILRQLVEQQNEKIQLLESKIKELRAKR